MVTFFLILIGMVSAAFTLFGAAFFLSGVTALTRIAGKDAHAGTAVHAVLLMALGTFITPLTGLFAWVSFAAALS